MSAEISKTPEERIAELEQKFNTHVATESLAHISRIYPKTNTIIFVGVSSFGGNIKYAFLAFHDYAKDRGIQCYFLTDDPIQKILLETANLPCLTSRDPNYLPLLFGAKIAVIEDLFYPQQVGVIAHALLQGARFVQLWHGLPLKEIGFKSQPQIEAMAACGPFEVLVSTNGASRDEWAQRFSFRDYAPLGYPRNDVLFRQPDERDLINVDRDTLERVREARRSGKPFIFYTPTFREYAGVSWFEKANLPAFADHCVAKGYDLCINLHPIEQGMIEMLSMCYPDIRFVSPHSDIYPLLKEADVLVTDYSSIAFDFLLLDRPLIFFRPDHEEFITKSCPLIPESERFEAAPIVQSIEALSAALDDAVSYKASAYADPYRMKRQSLRRQLFDRCDDGAGRRLCDLLYAQLLKR